MTPNFAYKAFNLTPFKAREITFYLFEPAMEQMTQEVEKLCLKIKEEKKLKYFNYRFLWFKDCLMYRPEAVYGPGGYYLDSENPEYDQIHKDYERLKNAMWFFAQWISIVLKSSTNGVYSQTSMNKLPPILFNYLCNKSDKFKEFRPNYQYKIPKEKERMWKNIEKLVQYYIGLDLLK